MLNRCIPGVNIFYLIGRSIFRPPYDNTSDNTGSHRPANCDDYGSLHLHIINDITRAGVDIAYFGVLSVFISYAILILLSIKCIVPCAVWTVIAGAAFSGFVACYHLWNQWFFLNESLKTIPEEEKIKEEEEVVKKWLYGAIVMTVVEVLILLIIIFLCNKIQIAILLFKESGHALIALPYLTLQPFFTVLVYIPFVFAQCYAFLLLISSEIVNVDETTGMVKYEAEEQTKVNRWIYIFCVLWLSEFIFACETLFISIAIAHWYFSPEKYKYRCCIGVCSSMFRAYYSLIRYHMGSAAFGSMIIAIIQFIRLAVFYFNRFVLQRKNKCAEKLAECLQCCLKCFQKFLEYLTRNAYIGVGEI